MAVRAANGRFVSRTNPLAVIARANARLQTERAIAEQATLDTRRRTVARNGYRGPLTRAELSLASLIPQQRTGE